MVPPLVPLPSSLVTQMEVWVECVGIHELSENSWVSLEQRLHCSGRKVNSHVLAMECERCVVGGSK